MTTTFKENIKNFMLDNINSLVEQFKNQICEDPDRLYNDLVYLIYKDLDIENLDIENLDIENLDIENLKIDKFEYTFDNNEIQIISLIEILTNDITDEYDKLVYEEPYDYINYHLKEKLYKIAIKHVLEHEIYSI